MTAEPFIFNGIPIDPEKTLRDLDRTELEDSFYLFCREAWKYVDSAPFTEGWALQAICEHLQAVCDGDIRRLIVNIPPRCGKSTLTSVMFPAWVWAQPYDSPTSGPGARTLCASYAKQLVIRDSVQCRKLIESQWYQGFWSGRFKLSSDQNTKHRFSNDMNGERLTTSVEATLTGEGGNIIIIDDANAANEVASEIKTQSVKDWWDGTMSTRHNDPKTGAFIVIQQRLAEDDLTGHIQETSNEKWDSLILPMRFEKNRAAVTSIGWTDPRKREGALLWPERFGEPEVQALERSLGPWRAAGQLQQRPEPKGGGIIKRDWWQLWDKPDPARVKFPMFDFILAALDTAYTEKETNDPSALTVWGIFCDDEVAQASRSIGPDGRPMYMDRLHSQTAPKLMLMGAWAERLELHELVKKTNKTCKDLKVDLLLIENKAAGHSVAQELQRLYSRQGYGVQLDDPKSQDKVSRLYSIQHLFAEGLVYAPDKKWADMVITQAAQFPKGRHDDLVDTMSAAIRKIREMGLLVRPEEHLEDLDAQLIYPAGQQGMPLYPA